MNNKNEDAFLRSIVGTSPIKKNNTLNRDVPINQNQRKNNKSIKNQTPTEFKKIEKTKNQSFFKLEKSDFNKKLKKGKIPINKKIDFHGLSVIDAQKLFFETIEICFKINRRCLLFITGKGILKKSDETNKDTKLYYGKIREAFFSWIQDKEMQKYILSVEQAGIEHGADGAFYVYLRKQKS